MEVAPKPHRWPLIVALIGLFAFCLSVPRYWRSTEPMPPQVVADQAGTDTERTHAGYAYTWERTNPFSSAALESLIAAQDIADMIAAAEQDALLAQLSAGLVPLAASPSLTSFSWPSPEDVQRLSPQYAPEPLQMEQPVGSSALSSWFDQAAGDAFRALGARLTVDATAAARTGWISDAASILGVWTKRWTLAVDRDVTPLGGGDPPRSTTEAVSPSTSLRLIGPTDRWAMVESATSAAQPEMAAAAAPRVEAPPALAGIWSSPDVLLLQLEHLTHYAPTQGWALQTLEQLRALVEGERRDRSQTAALLAALGDSAAAAAELAERVEDERLRVEVLRAHWALLRRLDCWTAMRDVRLAAISEARLAARGNMGPAFNGWSAADVAQHRLESLGNSLENYERFREPHVGRLIALAQRELRSSSNDLEQALADAVEENYRNANVRVAITADMINRFLSQERVQTQPVHDRIAGTPVRGHSETQSKSQVSLQPAVGRWQMELRTEGVVESETSSTGRAKAFTQGSTYFSATTPIVIGADGSVITQSSDVEANNCTQLVGVATSLDWMPIVGSFARSQVVSEYQRKRPQAKSEIEFKVAHRTREQVDQQAGVLVEDLRQKVRDRLTNPLARFGVEITPLEMTTTSERIVARLRIAGREQLAGHTPRPRALSDSLASMQLHESAMTNAAVALELNGERLTASQLQARFRDKLPKLALENPPTATDNTVFQFAPTDAVRFRIEDGRLELTLAIAEFSQQGTRISNFIVHADYAPVVNGLTAELVRDGALGIEGAVRSADRARLHNVFKVVLAEDRRLPIFRPDDPHDPRLAGLMITQLVLEDGWLGVSIGPAGGSRVAQRQRSLR